MTVKLITSLAVFAALWTVAPAPMAADAGLEQGGPRPELSVLMIASRSQEALSQETVQALEGQLSDLPVAFRVEWVDPIPDEQRDSGSLEFAIAKSAGADVCFWWPIEEPERVFLLIGGENTVKERSLDRTRAGGRAEAVALIVRATVNSELERRRRAVEEKRVAKSAESRPSEKAPPRDRPENAVSLQLAYALEIQDAVKKVAQGFGLGLGFAATERLSFFARYVFYERVLLSTPEVEIELRRHPVWLGACLAGRLEPFRIGAEVALVFDYVNDKTEVPASTSLEAEPGGGGFLFSAAVEGLVSVRVFQSVELFLLLGAEVPIAQPRYVVEGGAERTVLTPWPIRPIGSAGVQMGFF